MAGGSGCVLVLSVEVPHVAGIPVQEPEALAVCCSRLGDQSSWSLGEPNAEAVMGKAEEALRRRTRYGVIGNYLPRSRFGFMYVVNVETESCHLELRLH